ncbi:MAG: hypothetical protein HDT40_01110 [Lachnospiraceae bacterium]|nr:hypothetical protein [Lachnospiraceae bacterium]
MQTSKINVKKQSIKKATGFLIFLGIILSFLIIGSYFVNPLKCGIDTTVFEREIYFAGLLSEENDTVDVIILGNSETFGLISPMHLWQNQGIASYIAGQPGLRLSEEYYSLKTILKKQSPKLVILETNNIFDAISTFGEIKYTITTAFCHYFPIVKYHSFWKKYVSESKPQAIHYNGFSIRADVVPYEGGDYLTYTDELEKMDAITKHYLDMVVGLCRQNNIEVLFVCAPSPNSFSYKKHNSVQAYADANSIPFIDMNVLNEEIDINLKTDILDGGEHVNLYGTLKMTNYLEKYLTDNYSLPDRRQDKRYVKWHERTAEFMDELKEYQ